MIALALSIGSDCPFFIQNRPVIAKGRGEEMTKAKPVLNGYHILIVNPDIHISSAEAYAGITPFLPAVSLTEKIFSRPVSEWKGVINNDFENVIFTRHPEIKEIKELMYNNNALYASMTGSGSSVYGIFKDIAPTTGLPDRYWRWRSIL